MTIFKGIIVALGVASIGIAVVPASAQDMRHDDHAMNHDMGMHDNRGVNDGHGWHGDRHRWNHHRHCRTVWRHHHRSQRCW